MNRFALIIGFVVAAFAQPAAGPNLKSTEVLPDFRVVFRIYAPKASAVTLSGDFATQGRGTAGPMQKDDDGVWSLTVGPLIPDIYSYTFNVDGVRTVDPRNPMVKVGVSNLESMFFLPGPEAAYESVQPVPHGEVRAVWYESKTLGGPRRMHVYTPPGYERGNTKYPVLYLIHGGGDEDSGWSTIGNAGFILDNLIAAGKAKPMLVVMPNGSITLPGVANPMGGGRGAATPNCTMPSSAICSPASSLTSSPLTASWPPVRIAPSPASPWVEPKRCARGLPTSTSSPGSVFSVWDCRKASTPARTPISSSATPPSLPIPRRPINS